MLCICIKSVRVVGFFSCLLNVFVSGIMGEFVNFLFL